MFHLASCEEQKEEKHKKKDKEEQPISSDQTQSVKDNNTAIDCDTSFWKYVGTGRGISFANRIQNFKDTNSFVPLFENFAFNWIEKG